MMLQMLKFQLIELNYSLIEYNLSSVWRTLEMSLINSEIRLQLKWSKDCILVASMQQIKNKNLK